MRSSVSTRSVKAQEGQKPSLMPFFLTPTLVWVYHLSQFSLN